MTTRKRLHKLIEELPDTPETDQRLAAAEHVLEGNSAVKEPTKPGDIVDEWGNLSAMTRSAAGDLMHRLAEEEAATGHDPW
jgi:hypothetical protein